MQEFTQLLESFELLKKRKFKIVITEASKLAQESEAKAKRYVQLALQNSSSEENYIVYIPELGANARIFVARNGKQTGKVVVDNVISMYPIAVADAGGNPIKGSPTWAQFVNKFGKLEAEKGQQPIDLQPQGMQAPLLAPAPNQDIFSAALNFTKLAQNKQFFSLSRSLAAPSWNNPGPTGDFQEITRRISGPEPFSLESKINNSTTLKEDPLTQLKVIAPLQEEEKQLVSKIFRKFSEKVSKFYNGDFAEEDAIWINQRIVNDKNGFWIKDPTLLPQGVSLSWRYSNSDPQHGFFRHIILAYNKTYKQWAKDKGLKPNYPIIDTNKVLNADTVNRDFNSIRGKSAEELRVAVHALATGNQELATQVIAQVSKEYGDRLGMAFQSFIPYQEGIAGVDATVVDSLNFSTSLDKQSGGDIAKNILPKLVWLEKNGVIKRNPLAIDVVSGKTEIGAVSDLIEHYNDDFEAMNALNGYNLTPEDIKELAFSGKINIGLKTYLEESDITLSKRSINYMFTSLLDYKSNPFLANNMKRFGLLPEQIQKNTEQVQKVSQLTNILLSDISIPGFPSKALAKANINLFLGKMRENAKYKDLAILHDIENMDLESPYNKEKLKNYLENRLMVSLFKSKTNKDDQGNLSEEAKVWRKYFGYTLFSVAGSNTSQLLEIRFMNTLQSFALNHNRTLLDPINAFINGNLDLDNKMVSGLTLINPYTRQRYLRLNIETYRNINHLTLSLNKLYIKKGFVI